METGREEFPVEVEAGLQIESCLLVLDQMAADSARGGETQIQALELVGFQIRRTERKPSRAKIPIVSDPPRLALAVVRFLPLALLLENSEV